MRTAPLVLPSRTGSAVLPALVEEDLFLVDRSAGRAAPAAWPAARTLPLASSPATDLTALREDLLRGRRAAASAHRDADLVAVGRLPHGGPPTGGGLVIQVEAPDRRTAVEACRHLQGWLPVLGALTANSPFASGIDTGHASWRFVDVHRRALGALLPRRWSAGPADAVSRRCAYTEARLPEAMRYGHVRPVGERSVRVRAGDAGLSVDDTVVAVALVRTAVAAAVDAVRDGWSAAALEPGAVRDSQWVAARHGLTGRVADPAAGLPAPAWQIVDGWAATALRAGGDQQALWQGLARLRREGTGAERQRRIARLTPDAGAALTVLARLTTEG